VGRCHEKPVLPGGRGGHRALREVTEEGSVIQAATHASRYGDRGSGTVWMLALIGLTWSVAAMAMTVGGVRAARHRAYAAADLAALAAAAHVRDGPRSACRLAAAIARDSGGRLRWCVIRDRVSEVVVTCDVRTLPAVGRLVATARARAGPETAPDPGPAP
jgi:secretion/DNA translocation related TadE-like protein